MRPLMSESASLNVTVWQSDVTGARAKSPLGVDRVTVRVNAPACPASAVVASM